MIAYRFPSGVACKRPPRILYYEISERARRLCENDAHIVLGMFGCRPQTTTPFPPKKPRGDQKKIQDLRVAR
eukprot:1041835-Pyramimonas_sp.AAC.1